MVNRSKATGTAAESAVVKYLRENGFGNAERRALHGSTDLGDITGIPGVVIEVKAGKAAETASDGLVNAWLAETNIEQRNAKAAAGVLVLKRKGKATAGDWWAICRVRRSDHQHMPVRYLFKDYVMGLRESGYGDPL